MTKSLSTTSRLVPAGALLAVAAGNVIFVIAAAILGYLLQLQTERTINAHGDALRAHERTIDSQGDAIRAHDRILSEHEELLADIGDMEVAKAVDRLVVYVVRKFVGWDEQGLLQIEAPWEPATDVHSLDSIIRCQEGYEPFAVWHEVSGTYPSSDVLYTLNPRINEDGGIEIAVRARRSWQGRVGYAYLDVFALCRAKATSQQ